MLATHPTPDPAKKLLLIVEDDPDLALVTADVLDAAGYDTTIAGDGLAALDRLRGGARPAVILLDMSMPVLDGFGFRAEQARSPEFAAIPVIAVTADGDARRKARAISADGYLVKPVSIDTLLAEVARVGGEP
jgi:two-component system chemotaxis response regulator CheY